MSNQLFSGQGRDINLPAGQSLAVSSITGAYTATIIAGAGTGTALATASTGGGTYGPYAAGVTIRLVAGEGGLIDYDAAVTPSLTYRGSAREGYDASGNFTGLTGPDGVSTPFYAVHPGYFTHLFAGSQLPDDPKVYDISGASGHATPETDLTVSALWTTASGYASTLDPTTTAGQRLRKLRLPALNWDNAGGESLFLWWLGKATAEGSTTNLMGDNSGVAGENGIRIRVASTGQLAMTINEGTSFDTFSSSTLLPFDGGLHSIGIWINGQTRLGYSYVDETVQVGGTAIDALNTLPSAAQVTAGADLFRIGGDTQVGGAATSGIATATRALAIIKLAPTASLPTTAQVVAAMQALRAAPQFPLRRGAV